MEKGPASPPQDIRVHFSSWMPAGDGSAPSRTVILPSGTSLESLLRHLSAELGVDLLAATASRGNGFVVINENPCVMPRDLSRSLRHGDVVQVMPFIAGG